MTNSEFVNSVGAIGRRHSPLRVVSAEFERIAARRLPADSPPVPGPWGMRVESWEAVRGLLRDPCLSFEVVDAIWVWLIERSRAVGGDATVVCASLAEPMLARVVGFFAPPGSRHREDFESEVLTGFLTHLASVELDRPAVWLRLRWAAYRAGLQTAKEQQTHPVPAGDLGADLDPATEDRLLVSRSGHPESVLAEAVADGVISAEAAELITVSRWEHRTLTSLAAEHGQSVYKLRKQRRRAESRLLTWLTDPPPDRTHRRRTPPVAPRRQATTHTEVTAA
ncbi:hypothetical protein [Nocardia bovistercoris]|uniref:Uncharacterized protein n=1 Tax=Nocardia bovistercoris TaxID=2785916 RepID=A0A931N3Y2_9NOCA|nr:hypothetical protein [Nocardia bovistercoris]MBH0777681.1 hypothetical protein [Nocardia bovistercoris]